MKPNTLEWLATGALLGFVGSMLLVLLPIAGPWTDGPDCDTPMLETALWRVEAADSFANARELTREIESLTDIQWQVAGNASGYGKALNRAALWAELMSGCTPLGRDLTPAETAEAERLHLERMERWSESEQG